MDKIRFMVVSGFLGAVKTTTMIALAEHMNKTFGETAIIANDLGANLVDTNLTQTSGCTVAEIASGCICYQMDNTIDQIRRLRDKDGAVFVMSHGRASVRLSRLSGSTWRLYTSSRLVVI